jgi:hypothetical protein
MERRTTQKMSSGLHRQNIAVGTDAADHCLRRARQFRMAMMLVPGVYVRDVKLDDRTLEHLHRIEHRDGRERVSDGVDDERVGAHARVLDEVDQHAFVMALSREPGEVTKARSVGLVRPPRSQPARLVPPLT